MLRISPWWRRSKDLRPSARFDLTINRISKQQLVYHGIADQYPPFQLPSFALTTTAAMDRSIWCIFLSSLGALVILFAPTSMWMFANLNILSWISDCSTRNPSEWHILSNVLISMYPDRLGLNARNIVCISFICCSVNIEGKLLFLFEVWRGSGGAVIIWFYECASTYNSAVIRIVAEEAEKKHQWSVAVDWAER